MRTQFEYLREEEDLPARLGATSAEVHHVLLTGMLRRMNFGATGPSSFLTEDLQEAHRLIMEARESGQPVGSDYRADPKKGNQTPTTIPIENEEMPEMESDVQEMMSEVFG